MQGGVLAAAGLGILGIGELRALRDRLDAVIDALDGLREALASIGQFPAPQEATGAAAHADESAYRVLTLPLTVARSQPQPLSVWGTSLTVLLNPNVEWRLRFDHPANDPLEGTLLPTGSAWKFFRFRELFLENPQAPLGTAPLVLYVGRR